MTSVRMGEGRALQGPCPPHLGQASPHFLFTFLKSIKSIVLTTVLK